MFLSSRTLADGQHVFAIRVDAVVVVRRFRASPPVLRLGKFRVPSHFLVGYIPHPLCFTVIGCTEKRGVD
jgi:hypothetical protein